MWQYLLKWRADYLPANYHYLLMQSHIATQQEKEYDSIEYLLDVVESRMIECISPNATRVSEKSTSALGAAEYHLAAGGQRIRAKLALHAGLSLGLTSTDAVTIATAVELLHNASLVHDDVQDRDHIRRGQKAVWAHFGLHTAICTGDLLLSAAYAALCRTEKLHALPAMIMLVHERTASAIDGQCADLMASFATPSDTASAISHYQKIAIAKSGALMCLPIELALVATGQERYLSDARQAVEAFSIGYQIADDLNDVHRDTDAVAAFGGFNIVSIYKALGCAEESVGNAKKIGRLHLEAAIDSAARLPCGAGAVLMDYACQLRQLLNE